MIFNTNQKLFLSKIFLGFFVCVFAVFLSLHISLHTQYNLAVDMLIEHLRVVHNTETSRTELKKYLGEKENQKLNVVKEIKEIKEIKGVKNENENENEIKNEKED